MTTNLEKIKSLNCKEFAKLITRYDLFCELCAYDLNICTNECEKGHEAWLNKKYTSLNKEKEKLPRKRG